MLVNREQLARSIGQVYPFNLATPAEIAHLADGAEVVFFEAGKVIFQEGAKARYLYLIIEGGVEILKEDNRQLLNQNYLMEGSLFGEDAIGTNPHRQSSARAREDCILVRLEKNVIRAVLGANQEIGKAFELLFSSYEMLMKEQLDSIMEKETVCFLGRPHRFIFLIKSLVSSLFFFLLMGVNAIFFRGGVFTSGIFFSILGALAIVLLLFILWRYIEWRNDHYIFTNKRVICEDRVVLLHDLRFEIPLNAIVNLNIRKSIFGRSFGFGDLLIKTFTGLSRLKHVSSVEVVAGLLDNLWKKEKLVSRREDREAFQQALNNQTDTLDASLLSPTGESQGAPGFDQDDEISLFARVKRRKEGERVYHTHWIILISKFIFPSLIFTGTAMLFLFLSINHYGIINNTLFQVFLWIITAVSFFWGLYQYVDWRRDQYIITADQIIDVNRKPFGIEDLRTAPIKNIQSVRYKKAGLPGLLFNFGTVYIRVGDDELTFDHVPNPAAVQQVLFGALENFLSQQKKADLSEQQRRLADWMAAYLDSDKKNPSGQS